MEKMLFAKSNGMKGNAPRAYALAKLNLRNYISHSGPIT